MKSFLLFFLLFPLALLASVDRGQYPQNWWMEVPRDGAPGWEILPQDAKAGEVVLSKRTALGVFSNFAEAHFILDGVNYSSIEGLWQSLKYPEENLSTDPRHIYKWPYIRSEVEQMVAWDAKSAGNLANSIYHENNITEVSYMGYFFDYVDRASGSDYHYKLIKRAIRAKVTQNPEIKELLLQTKGLRLIPDHFMSSNVPRSFNYHLITMEIRKELLNELSK